MEKKEQLYEGKAKILYQTDDPTKVVAYFKDDATAFNAQKKGTILNKGIINNEVSSHIFRYLEKQGIPTHFIEKISDREMLCRHLTIIPIEVILRNIVAGSLSKRTGFPEGKVLPKTLMEYYYKSDELGDPMLNRDHILLFQWATEEQLQEIERLGYRINEILVPFFKKINIQLVDFKLEFGYDQEGQIYLADEITPDGCRLWDAKTNEKLDKDRFRRDLGKIEESYQKVRNAVLETAI